MIEEWKKIPCSNGHYEASTFGNIRSIKAQGKRYKGENLKSAKNKNGYMTVALYVDGNSKTYYVHNLVTQAFYGDRGEGEIVRHYDGVKTNNRLENLVYGSYTENWEDALRHGDLRYGETHHNSKFSQDQIQKVREGILNGKSISEVSEETSIPRKAISEIINGKIWRHLGPEMKYTPRYRKIDANSVLEIRKAFEEGQTYSQLSHKYGITNGTLYAIKIRKTWKWVE